MSLVVLISDPGLGRNQHIERVPTVVTTGSVESVRFLIIIGGRIVKSVVSFILLVILSRDLKTGSVLSVVTLIMLVERSAIVVSASRMKKIDSVIKCSKFLYCSRISNLFTITINKIAHSIVLFETNLLKSGE